MPTYLGALLLFSYASLLAPPPYAWVHWPVTVSLLAVLVSAVVLKIGTRRLATPPNVVGLRRGVLYIAALVIGVILDYAITLDAIGPRGFRIGVFLLFGAPLFAWLFFHLAKHRGTSSSHQKRIQVLAIVSAVVLLALYAVATLTGRVA
jgi:hypothetical protein